LVAYLRDPSFKIVLAAIIGASQASERAILNASRKSKRYRIFSIARWGSKGEAWLYRGLGVDGLAIDDLIASPKDRISDYSDPQI
jgi:hypothetical protein